VSAVAVPAGATESRRARNGFGLLILAVAGSLVAYALQGLGLHGEVPRNLAAYSVLFAGASLGGWFVIRYTARSADPALYPVAVLLGGLGLAMLYRLMDERGRVDIARDQAVWLLIGLACFALTLVIVRDIRQLDTYTYTIGLAGIVLLLLPIVPGIGYSINGARLWVNLGFLQFQPAEFGRVLIVIFLASYLSQRRELLAAGVGRFGLPRVKDLGPLLLAWGTSLAVLLPPVGILTVLQYWRANHVDVPVALWAALGFLVGGYLGGSLAQLVSGTTLRRIFAVFLIVAAVDLLRRS